LTISDAHSRYLLRCQAVAKTDTARVQAIFEAAFRQYGLPQAIRTDNGPPFATTAIAGLSRLAVWWITLGIVAERIEAGQPQQNGRHERMHRTLNRRWRCQRRRIGGRNNAGWRASGRNTTKCDRMKRWPWKRRPACMSLVAAVPGAGAGAGVSVDHGGAQRACAWTFSLADIPIREKLRRHSPL
jgi:hypothetical protein